MDSFEHTIESKFAGNYIHATYSKPSLLTPCLSWDRWTLSPRFRWSTASVTTPKSLTYQTGVMSTTCDSPTDAVSDWTLILIVCAGVSSRRLSFSLLHVRTVGHSVGFRCGHGKCLFVSEQNHANVTGWIFFNNCFEWLDLAWLFASLSSGHGDLWAQTFHKVV